MMPTKIEALQSTTDGYVMELENLKKDISQASVEKTDSLKSRLESAKMEVEAQINSLQNKTDVVSVQEVEKAKMVLAQIEQTLQETKDLQKSVDLNQCLSGNLSATQSNPVVQQEQGFLGKSVDRLKENMGKGWDRMKKNWKELTLGVGTFLGGTWLFKSLFADSDDSEDEEEGEKRTKKKGFRKTAFGKFLKWTGIGVGAGTVGYRLSNKLGLVKGDSVTDDADDQADNTVDLHNNDSEKYEKYKGIGEYVDSQYSQVMKKEIDAGWGGMSIADGYEKYADKNSVSKDVFQATVPMIIDKEYTDIQEFLSEGGYYSYLRGLKLNELKNEIISWGKDKIGKVLGPFLINLTSFIPYKGDDWSESLERWFNNSDVIEIENELNLFFRQHAKILQYTQDKLLSLEEKIAEEKIVNSGGDFSSVSDALRDKDWVEEYVHADERYRRFVGSKLYQSVDVLKQEGLFNDILSDNMQMITQASDAERDVILSNKDGKDSLQRLTDAGIDLTPEILKEGEDSCSKIVNDIEDNFDDSFSYAYFSCFHGLFNTDENNVQEFLEHSGLNMLKANLKESLEYFKQKFAKGTITQDDINIYKDQVNSYFAMKKEILIAAVSIQQMKSDSSNIGVRLLNFISDACSDLVAQTTKAISLYKDGKYLAAWGMATIPLYLGGKVIYATGKYADLPLIMKLGNTIADANAVSVAVGSRSQVLRRVWSNDLTKVPTSVLSQRYNHSHGDQLLLQDLIEGKVYGKRATKLFKSGANKKWIKVQGATSVEEFVQKMLGLDSVTFSTSRINALFNNEEGIAFLKNETIRKNIFGEPSAGMWENTGGAILHGFRKKNYSPIGVHHVEMIESFFKQDGGDASAFKKLQKNQQKFFKKIIEEGGDFSDMKNLQNLIDNIGEINLKGFDEQMISQLVEKVSKDMSYLGDVGDKNGKMCKEIDNIMNSLSDEKKRLNNSIDDAIESIKGGQKYEDISVIKKARINKLEKLKNAKNITDDEIRALKELGDAGFDVKYFPDFIKIFHIKEKVSGLRENVGEFFRKILIDKKDFPRFISELKNEKFKKVFKNIDVDGVASSFEKVYKNFVKKLDGLGDLLKIVIRVLKNL